MKNKLFVIGLSLISLRAYTQPWQKGGNNVSPFPFILGSNTNNVIGFETNNLQRMLINNGGGLAADGSIAMGNNLAIGFTPQSRLHLHQTLGIVDFRLTNAATGAFTINKFNY